MLYLVLIMNAVFFHSCKKDYSNNDRTPSKEINNDSVQLTCEQIVAKFKEIIYNDLNVCNTDSDCKVVGGECPLGPWFIVNKDRINSFESINEEVRIACGPCKYDLPKPPYSLKCKDSKCYPAINESSTILMFFTNNCEKLVQVYSEDLIGKNIENLELSEFLYRVISETDTRSLSSPDPYSMKRAKVIIDENGMIKSLECDR